MTAASSEGPLTASQPSPQCSGPGSEFAPSSRPGWWQDIELQRERGGPRRASREETIDFSAAKRRLFPSPKTQS